MSPLLQQTLEQKELRRKRLMALSYPEKVRIVEQMRKSLPKRNSTQQPTLREEPSSFGQDKG